MSDKKTPPLSYRDAGVDIDKGNAFVEAVKTAAKSTMIPGVLAGIGGFSACFELNTKDYDEPVLCACTDGVGTKLKLAHTMNDHSTIGIDLVAMCANDLIVNGAKPLFFLDYYATGSLDSEQAVSVVQGIAEGCQQAGMALIGGETAEMPGFYQQSEYDLAGFSVGVVEKSKMLVGNQVSPGDKLIALQSSGLHSNGYSLIRRLIHDEQCDLNSMVAGVSLGQLLLAPTKIYVSSVLKALAQGGVHAMAHITGGGLAENLARVLPSHVSAVIRGDSWTKPAIYQWLDQFEQIQLGERFRTFNEGIGMVLCVASSEANKLKETLEACGETVFEIGEVKNRHEDHSKNQVEIL